MITAIYPNFRGIFNGIRLRTILLPVVFSIATLPVLATNFYWIGGAGNWSDAAHWSLASGGPGQMPCYPVQRIMYILMRIPVLSLQAKR